MHPYLISGAAVVGLVLVSRKPAPAARNAPGDRAAPSPGGVQTVVDATVRGVEGAFGSALDIMSGRIRQIRENQNADSSQSNGAGGLPNPAESMTASQKLMTLGLIVGGPGAAVAGAAAGQTQTGQATVNAVDNAANAAGDQARRADATISSWIRGH